MVTECRKGLSDLYECHSEGGYVAFGGIIFRNNGRYLIKVSVACELYADIVVWFKQGENIIKPGLITFYSRLWLFVQQKGRFQLFARRGNV
jgi:hypothetical protein